MSIRVDFTFSPTSTDFKHMLYVGKGHATLTDVGGATKCVSLQNNTTMEIGLCDTTLGYQRDHQFFIIVSVRPLKMSIVWNGMLSDVGRLYKYERLRVEKGISPLPEYRTNSKARMPIFHTDEEDDLFYVDGVTFRSIKTNEPLPHTTPCKCEGSTCVEDTKYALKGVNAIHQFCTKCAEEKVLSLFLYNSKNCSLLHALKEHLAKN